MFESRKLASRMNLSALLVLVLCSKILTPPHIEAQHDPGAGSHPPAVHHLIRPNTSTIVAIIVVMSFTSCLLLTCVRFCFDTNRRTPNTHHLLIHSRSRLSGIDREIIDSLPFFAFSGINGSRQGLECAICLTKFEDSDVLRLLPKCRHAFHINCIDRWLVCHSSCPLCRYKFDPKDPKNFSYSNSLRFLHVNSNLSEDPNVEILVQREEDRSSRGSSSRFDRGKQELLIPEVDLGHGGGERKNTLDKLKHRIIVSNIVTKNRWSDVNPSDMLSLNSEMIGVLSSQRFCSPEEELSTGRSVMTEDTERTKQFEGKLTNVVGNKRSISEIVNVPRLKHASAGSCCRAPSCAHGGTKESVRRLWLPIVRRTVKWSAGRHHVTEESDNKNSRGVNIV